MTILEHNPPQPLGSLLLLHGLGANGADLYPLASEIVGGRLRVVCPTAPTRAVTVNGGWQMPAWYDITGADLAARQDAAGAAASAAMVEDWLAAEKARGFASQRIFLAGFSQGAALSLYAGLRHAESLGGIIALSGYLLLAEALPQAMTAAQRHTPIFQAHGVFDTVVLPAWARQCRDTLTTVGLPLSYHEYHMAHAIAPEELQDLNQWLQELL